ncbi:MAG: BON domain-containing protein [Planctomycetaceae bacterium]|uniref:Periplasmic protein n=1 Tax=Lacipirellula limnantheis TaxID=2528024 RepID=A0A517U585_9BACT|nr:BON domain-containing protein [Planctomycetaceae bacterium]QDT75720.1 periplasmic protein [Lacipirellula limnantheis]
MKTTPEKRSEGNATESDLALTVQNHLVAKRTDFRRVNVAAEGRIITLSGLVHSFFLRQTAIVLARQVAGVHQVIDKLTVEWKETSHRTKRPH